jgi:hypothetical protein
MNLTGQKLRQQKWLHSGSECSLTQLSLPPSSGSGVSEVVLERKFHRSRII